MAQGLVTERGTVPLKSVLTGDVLEVPEDEAQAFIDSGRFSPESPGEFQEREIREEFDRPIEAGALGLARGATFGLSDVALSKLGARTPEELSLLREVNPLASVGGEIGGALGSAFIPGGALATIGRGAAGVGARAAGLTARALGTGAEAALPRIAGAAVSTGLESEAIGAGQGISEAALGRQRGDEAFETIATSALEGLAFGGVLGAGIRGAGLAVQRATKGGLLDIKGLSKLKRERALSEAKLARSRGNPRAGLELNIEALGSEIARRQATITRDAVGAVVSTGVGVAIGGATGGIAGAFGGRIIRDIFKQAVAKRAGAAVAKAAGKESRLGRLLDRADKSASETQRDLFGILTKRESLPLRKIARQAEEDIERRFSIARRATGLTAAAAKASTASRETTDNIAKEVISVDSGMIEDIIRMSGVIGGGDIAGKAIQAIEYLKRIAPPIMASGTIPTSLSIDFNERANAVLNPGSVFESMEKGNLSIRQVEALQEVHAEFLEEVRSAARDELETAEVLERKITKKQRRIFSTLLRNDRVTPDRREQQELSAFQGARVAEQEQQQAQPQQQGNVNLTLSERLQTQSQQLGG